MKQIITNFTNGPKRVSHFSWGGVIAGTITIFSLLVLLNLFGLGIGLIQFNPEMNPFLDYTGILWLAISNVVAVFCGGLVAARTAGFTSRVDGALQGFLSWGLYIILSTIFYSSVTVNDLGELIEIGAKNHSFLLFCILLLGSLAGLFGGAQTITFNPEGEAEI